MNFTTTDFIRNIPKTDLHVHLDGSLRLSSLIEMARQRGVKLPSETEEGLRELVFKQRYNNLVEYLEGFSYTVAVPRRWNRRRMNWRWTIRMRASATSKSASLHNFTCARA